MVTDISELIKLCSAELIDRQYKLDYAEKIQSHWDELKCWMGKNSLTVFSERIANLYCDYHIGTHLFLKGMSLKDKTHLRAIRMLVSYQKDGEFEFRSPRVE